MAVVALGAGVLAIGGSAAAQFGQPPTLGSGAAPVTVDDSPSALLLIQRAVDQAAPNPPDAIRAIQEVLDELGEKLVPLDDEPDRLVSARQAAHDVLRRRPALLERYRQTEQGRARALLERGELDRLWRTRMLTEQGLQAGLRLAESAVERAHFATAAALLEEVSTHPTLAGVASDAAREADRIGAIVQLERLRGMVAHATGNLAGAIESLDTLDALRTPLSASAATSLRALIDGGAIEPDTGRGTLDAGVAPPAEPTTWHLIARVPMPNSLYARQFALVEQGRAGSFREIDRPRLIASLLTAAPTVWGHLVFVNEGSVVRAFDRLSGRTHWITGIGGGGVGRDESPVGDLNAIAVVDGHLVTVDGHAHATERTSTARVVSLDPETGAIRWATSLDRIDVGDDLAPGVGGLSPHGAPVIVDGLVLTLARKVTPRFEIVSYLVALDLTDGSLRWARHLCSSAGARLSGLRPHTSPSVVDGAIFATLSTGAMARIDARSGEIAWLVRVPVPIRDPRFLTEPWEIGAALPTSRGILTVAPDQRHAILLDATSGRELERHPIDVQAPLGEVRYFLRTEGRDGRELVIAVGSDVVAFGIDDLTTPLWSLVRRDPRRGADLERRAGVRGRVHAADGVLAIPGEGTVLLVDAETGQSRQEVAVGGPGNPLLVGPQLVLATHDAVECHMPFAAAERLIRERIRTDPSSAEHGLALVGLGLRAGSLATVLDGADSALGAVAQQADRVAAQRERSELFLALLDVDPDRLAESDDDGVVAYHAMLARVASEPWQRTMRRLVQGDWLLRRGRPAEAATVWQEILDQEALSEAAVPIGQTRLAGGAAARGRLRELVAAHGTAAVATQADEAARELAALVDTGAGVPELLALARRRPMTPAASAAVLRAAEVAIEAEAPRLALQALLWGWRDRIGTPGDRRAIAESALEVALAARWWRLAHDLASAAAGDGLVDRAVWTRRIADAGGGRRPEVARLGAFPSVGRELRGGLALPAAGAEPLGFRDRALLVDGTALVLLDGELSERWRTVLPSAGIEILLADPRGVLVSTRSAEEVRLTWLDADTGETRWQGAATDEMLPASRPTRADERREPGDLAVPFAVGDGIVLLRRDGAAARVALDDGATVRWRLNSSIRRVNAVAVSDAAIVIAGPDSTGGGELVVVVDPETGRETVRHRLRTGTEARWIAVAPVGLAVIGTESGIEAIDALGERSGTDVAWSVSTESLRGTSRGWTTSRWLLVSDGFERLVALQVADGMADPGRFETPRRAGGDALAVRDLRVTPSGLATMFDRRVVDFGHDGSLRGVDAVADEHALRLLAVAEGMLVSVGLVGGAQVEIAPGVHRTQHQHRVHLLDRTAGLRLLGPPLEVGSVGRPFERVEAIDGWLLLSSGVATVAVPLLE